MTQPNWKVTLLLWPKIPLHSCSDCLIRIPFSIIHKLYKLISPFMSVEVWCLKQTMTTFHTLPGSMEYTESNENLDIKLWNQTLVKMFASEISASYIWLSCHSNSILMTPQICWIRPWDWDYGWYSDIYDNIITIIKARLYLSTV